MFFDIVKLNHRTELYGVLSLWIMLMHLDMFFHPLLGNVYLGRVAALGECCVDVFLFLSGYCVSLSWEKTPVYRIFMKKRFLRILPSYLLIAIPYFVWKDGFSPDVLYDVSGVSFLAAGRLDAWFPVAILLFYCLTPLLVRLLSGRRGVCSYLLILSLCVVLLRFSPYVGRTAIMWSRLPAYALGILCALNRMAYRPGSPLIFLSSGIIVAVFALTPLIPKLTAFFGSSVYRLFFLLLIFPIIILYNAFADHSRESGILRRFFALCGNVSLELYLIHLFLLYIISFYGLNTILYPLALVAAIPLACFVVFLTKPIE